MDLKDYNSVQAEILNNLYADYKAKNNNVANVELPFGEKTVMGDTLTWDGNTEGLECFDGRFYHVSDVTPTLEDLQKGGAVADFENFIETFDSSAIKTPIENMITITIAGTTRAMIALTDNVDVGGYVIEKTGVYLYDSSDSGGDMQMRKLKINGYNGFPRTEITPLPNKYLDIVETIGLDTLTWDGNTEGLVCVDAGTMDEFPVKLYLVSENCPTYAEVCNGGTIMQKSPDGGMISKVDTNGINEINDVVNVNGAVFIAKTDNAVYNDGFEVEFVAPKKGIYFVALCSASGEILMNVTSLTINGYTGFQKEQVKQEYLSVADLVIQLNTAPGVKPTIDNVSIIKGSISNVKQMIKDQKCPSVAVRFTFNDNNYYMRDTVIKGNVAFYAGFLDIGYITNVRGTEFGVGYITFSENGEFNSADVRIV